LGEEDGITSPDAPLNQSCARAAINLIQERSFTYSLLSNQKSWIFLSNEMSTNSGVSFLHDQLYAGYHPTRKTKKHVVIRPFKAHSALS